MNTIAAVDPRDAIVAWDHAVIAHRLAVQVEREGRSPVSHMSVEEIREWDRNESLYVETRLGLKTPLLVACGK